MEPLKASRDKWRVKRVRTICGWAANAGLKNYLQRSCPSEYIRHIHHAIIIIFETSHRGLIMASFKRARQTPSLLTLSPFPLFSSLAFSASFLLPDLFPSSSISWAMLAVSISFFNLDFIGCHVFDSWFDIWSGHIYFQGQYFLYFSPFVWSILLVMFIALVVFVFNSFLVIIFSFCSRSQDFSLTWESNSLSDYRRVRLLSLKPRLFLCCPHSTTLSFRLQLPSFSIYPSDRSRERYFRWLRFFSNLIERLQRDSWARWITPLQICLILQILRKPNSLIALLFIQNNS